MNTKLHVSNLPADATEQSIRELFARTGTVLSVTLVKDPFTGASKRFAFVEMASQRETRAALASLDGCAIGENLLAVRLALRTEVPVPYHNRSHPNRDLRG